MRTSNYFFFALLLIIAACTNSGKNNSDSAITQNPIKAESKKGELFPFLDTAIHLNVLKGQYGFNVPITDVKARNALYKYFEAKGMLRRQDMENSQDSVNNGMSIEYDTIYHIKGGKYGGAVVSYWIGPSDLNGHCFQPSKAFIQTTTDSHLVSNENFIPPNFALDSSSGSYIYGYDYDCGGRGVVRRFRIALE
jgi:hypothetical protein